MNVQDYMGGLFMERQGTGPQRAGEEASHGTAPLAVRPNHHPEVAPARYYVIHQFACRFGRGWAVFEMEEEAIRNLAEKADCGGRGCHVAVEVLR